MAVLTYDPKQVAVVIGGQVISGFADGTFVKVERNEPAFNLKVGVDGEGTRAKSNNKSGKYTITLMQSSSSNDYLSSLAQSDEASNSGVVPVYVNDKSGRSLYSSLTAWVQKYADGEYQKETTTRTWVIESDEILMNVAGN